METIRFKVQEYEGPLDLILHLIAKHQLNILDIEISDLLNQYQAAIRQWQDQQIAVSAEFLEMAARLVYIKTVSLLPRPEEAEDPRAELVGQLLEYQACKEAAALLAQRSEGFSLFVRRPEKIEADNTYRLFHPASELAHAYLDARGRGRRRMPPPSEVFSPLVARPVVSVASRILHVLRGLYHKSRMSLSGLYRSANSRSQLVATFLAVLELVKSGRVSLEDENDTILLNRQH